MANLPQSVRPGDLITAELMTDLLKKIGELEGRVVKLEGSVVAQIDVVIDALAPAPSTNLRVGDTLTVSGEGFTRPATTNIVTLGGTLIEIFRGDSSDTQLIFTIPPVANLPRDVTLTVANRNGGDTTAPFTLYPRVELPQGDVRVDADLSAVGKPEVGKPFRVWFLLTPELDPSERFQIAPDFLEAIGTAGAASWRANTTLIDQAGKALNAVVKLEHGNAQTVGLEIKPPTGAQRVTLVLSLKALTNEALTTSSDPITITIGQDQPVSNPNTTFELEEFGGASKGKIATIDGKETVLIPFKGSATVRLEAHFTIGGTYIFSHQLDSKGAEQYWTVGPVSPSESEETAGSSQAIGFSLTSKAERPAGDAHPEDASVVIKATRTTTDDHGQFESWRIIPIRGY